MEFERKDLAVLKNAKVLLENPSLAAKAANLLGAPLEKGFAQLPASWSESVMTATRAALAKAMDVAISTVGNETEESSSDMWHRFAVAATGGLGGALGIGALAVELPVSTTIMLRSIADIARSEGENLRTPAAHMACLEVFALGGPGTDDDGSETGYFFVRAALSKAVSSAASHIAQRGVTQAGAPILAKMIVLVAERFSVQVSQKVAAQAVPVVGAAGGALINTLFIDHFQSMARGHFTVRRLERKYGRERVEKAYGDL